VGTPQKQAGADFAREVSRLIFENKLSAVGKLWEKLDANAQAKIINYIGYYIGHNSDRAAIDDRRRRAALIKGALDKQIKALRKAHKERTAFEEIEVPQVGKVSSFRGPVWPQENVALSMILSTEILRLNKLLGQAKKVYNMRRLGVAGKFYWLLHAQEFLGSRISQHPGEVLELTPTHLADLIDAALTARKRHPKNPTDPENIRKALANFRKNPDNNVVCDLIRHQFTD
jgi:hypothetical protein